MLWSLDELEVAPGFVGDRLKRLLATPAAGAEIILIDCLHFLCNPASQLRSFAFQSVQLASSSRRGFQLKQSSALSSACCLIGVRETQIRNT